MEFKFPPLLAFDTRYEGNTIRQLLLPGYSSDVWLKPYVHNQVKGYVVTPVSGKSKTILVFTGTDPPLDRYDEVLHLTPNDSLNKAKTHFDASKAKWVKHPDLPLVPSEPIDYDGRVKDAVESWHGAFTYRQENPKNKTKGLRAPQIGAVHAAHAHWATTDDVATIVMPTGTGKTETMLSLLVSNQCERLLVVVPTDALRTQIAEKFLTLGVLKDAGVVAKVAHYPVVGILKHKPRNNKDVDIFFSRCNVIVTTMNIAGQCPEGIQKQMAHHCPYVFIDEAHHVAASTWYQFKEQMKTSKILQFTATPFRNDDKPLEGKFIFDYPLINAQKNRYFKPVHLREIEGYDPDRRVIDKAIATKALEKLVEDRNKGYDHILMARVESIARAHDVYDTYKQCIKRQFTAATITKEKLQPVQIHTGIRASEREITRQQILNKESRVIICVDMLGEGFDLPELKIAAFHDIRKSLPVTLQLVGRFTRTRSKELGDATVFANTTNAIVDNELSKLYAHKADWNRLLRRLSKRLVQEQKELQDFIKGFKHINGYVSLQNIRSKVNAVVYKTACKKWTPDNYKSGIREQEQYRELYSGINEEKKTIVIIMAREAPPDWITSDELIDQDYGLCVVFWDKKQELLFIHCAGDHTFHRELAEAVAGDVEHIKEDKIFRSLAGIRRLKLHNVGLRERPGRLISYSLRVGSDVEPGISEIIKRNAQKCNISGTGYEKGRSTSIGCSVKSKVWAPFLLNLAQLTEWCSFVGEKISDETIDPDKILEGTLVPEVITRRPGNIPIRIDWPNEFYKESETTHSFLFDAKTTANCFNTDINLVDPDAIGDIRFELRSNYKNAVFSLSIFETKKKYGIVRDYKITQAGRPKAKIKHRKNTESLEKFFYNHPPVIWFTDGSYLEGNLYTKPRIKYDPYPEKSIDYWEWGATDITKESQQLTKRTDSIQYKVISELKKKNYNVIFDDDDTGEAADIVAIQAARRKVVVEFYHCKYASDPSPRGHIEDLYEVCGQAQKSVHWVEKPLELYKHLERRNKKRLDDKKPERFEKGDLNQLLKMKNMSLFFPVTFKIFIVQPGLSKALITPAQKTLLSVTDNYLKETYQLPFGVIASK